MSAVWSLFFGWLPPVIQVVFLALIAIVLIIIVFRIIALILDAIPFL